MKTFCIHTFGCKVNQEEGESLVALFVDHGWQEAAPQTEALLYIVNACTVTQTADKKARALIRRLRREHPQALLAVTGCYAQVAAEQIAALAAVDIIAGLNERAQLPSLVEQLLRKAGLPKAPQNHELLLTSPKEGPAYVGAACSRPQIEQPLSVAYSEKQPLIQVSDIATAASFTPIGPARRQKRARAYLKIEDGCGQSCHYCIIPLARGPVRSLPLTDALTAASELIKAGHLELVLSGIHIGAYGLDLPLGQDLPVLIERILAIPGSFRLRLGSIEPRQFSDQLLRLWANEPRICPHLHIPLQSGSDAVLAAMNRNYCASEYAALLTKVRALRLGCAITTDIMIGYPGETATDVEATMEFCGRMAFARMHVFPYSKRPGTVAATLTQQAPQKEKERRAALLGELAANQAAAYARSYIGAKLEYLHEQEIELEGRRYYSGHSANYLPLLLPAAGPPPQDMLTVRALAYRSGFLLCENQCQQLHHN